MAINAVFWPHAAVVILDRWHSLEQGWNNIAHIQAELLEPIFGPGIIPALSLCWRYRGSHKEHGIKLKMDLQEIRL